MLADVVLDKLHKHGRHICALRRGCGLEGVVETDFDVDVHSLKPCSFPLLDPTHPLSMEVSLYGYEYPPPVLRMVRGLAEG